MQREQGYISLFNRSIRIFFRDALRVSLRNPGVAFSICRIIRRQNRAARLRQSWEKRGVHVPPVMIASITNGCNLHCKGCYARAHRRSPEPELSPVELRRVIAEAEELGISIVLIAGGEPLTRPEILDIARGFPGIVFPLFTNGLLLDEAMIERFRTQRNVVPVISIEGHQGQTDQRRGLGVHQRVLAAMARMKARGVFFGTSLTLTRENFALATDKEFIRELLAAGCRLFFFVDYVPVQEGTEDLVLTAEQRAAQPSVTEALRAELGGLFVAFPGDEEMYGGCLAAGRGFIHVSPEGRLEPCPFSPFSDASLREVSLREALQSRFLRTIRESGAHLGETRGGCALWEKRAWVASLLHAQGHVT